MNAGRGGLAARHTGEKRVIGAARNALLQQADSKRPRRAINPRAQIENDKDPYIYTGYGAKGPG